MRYLVVGVLLLIWACGCHTWHPVAANFDDPAWTVYSGQAVWHPAQGDTEIAGEFLLGVTADGRGYVQFSKPPVVLAEARADADHWLASFPALRRTYSGPGSPPRRLAWNQVLLGARGRPPADGWEWTGSVESRWRLAHGVSGEWIEGMRLP